MYLIRNPKYLFIFSDEYFFGPGPIYERSKEKNFVQFSKDNFFWFPPNFLLEIPISVAIFSDIREILQWSFILLKVLTTLQKLVWIWSYEYLPSHVDFARFNSLMSGVY